MKRIALLLALTATVFVSCKKEYTCECTRTDTSKFFPEATTTETIYGKKEDVAEHCSKGDSTSGTLTYSCVIN
jgi:hypothetical protein